MRIDVYHDTACPWCRIGKRNLKTALAAWDGETVDVRYRTYFLDPTIRPDGEDFLTHMQAKGGGRVPSEQWFAGPREAGKRVGLIFNFDRISRAPNTLLSHQVIALTPPDKREAVTDAIYAAYFEEGRDIGDVNVLLDIAEAYGLDKQTLGAQLAQAEMRDQILAEAEQAMQLGVSGVPFFVINERYAFSGAQPPEVILRTLRQVVQLEKQKEQAETS